MKSHFPKQSFLGRDNVRELYLNDSGIVAIGNATFAGLGSLEVLHLVSTLKFETYFGGKFKFQQIAGGQRHR